MSKNNNNSNTSGDNSNPFGDILNEYVDYNKQTGVNDPSRRSICVTTTYEPTPVSQSEGNSNYEKEKKEKKGRRKTKRDTKPKQTRKRKRKQRKIQLSTSEYHPGTSTGENLFGDEIIERPRKRRKRNNKKKQSKKTRRSRGRKSKSKQKSLLEIEEGFDVNNNNNNNNNNISEQETPNSRGGTSSSNEIRQRRNLFNVPPLYSNLSASEGSQFNNIIEEDIEGTDALGSLQEKISELQSRYYRELHNRARRTLENRIEDENGKLLPETLGQKVIKDAMEENRTETDINRKLINDPYNLVFKPCKHPDEAMLDVVLGPTEPQQACFLCSYGNSQMRIKNSVLNRLREFFEKNAGTMEPWRLALGMWELYEKTIRIPNNKIHGEGTMPVWSPRSIHDHMTHHNNDPSCMSLRQITMLKRMIKQLDEYGVYKCLSSNTKAIRKNSEIRVDQTNAKLAIALSTELRRVYAQNPHKMMFHDPVITFTPKNNSIVRPEISTTLQRKSNSVFDNKTLKFETKN